MRGWAIFVMVWVHSTWLALGADKVYMWSFAVVYPMPVFFAVLGYLWSYKNRPGVPWRRWLKMLVLLLVGSLGYALLFGEDAWGMFSDMYYYWFFAALLLCELCQYGLDRLALGRTARAALQVYIVGAVLLWNVFWWCMEDFGANRFGIPWADMESYWLFYAMGAMMGRDLKARRALTTWPMAAIGALLLAYGIYCGKGAGSPGGLAGGLGAVTLTWWAFRQLSIRTHRGASLHGRGQKLSVRLRSSSPSGTASKPASGATFPPLADLAGASSAAAASGSGAEAGSGAGKRRARTSA